MNTLKTLCATGIAGSLLVFPLAGSARVDIDVEIAPPPVVVEEAPVREGYIYAPGYWDWDDAHHRYNWKRGEYVEQRHGEHWVPHAWAEHNGHYRFNQGHWERNDHGS